MVVLEIPVAWTAGDALVVVGLLEKLVNAIWQAYGEEMGAFLEAMNDDQNDDDLRF